MRKIVLIIILTAALTTKTLAGVVDEFLRSAQSNSFSLEYYQYTIKVKKLLVKETEAKKGLQLTLSSYLGKEKYQSIYMGSVFKNLKYYTMSASKTIYLPGFEHQIKQKELDVDIASLDYKSEISNLNARVLQTLVNSAAAEMKISILRKLQKLTEERIRLYRELYENRKVPKLLILQEKEELLRYQLLENRESQKLRSRLKQLNSYCQTNFSDSPVLLDDSLEALESIKNILPELEKKRENNDVKKASLEKEKALEEVKYRKYLRYPKVSVNAYYSYASSSAISTASRDLRVFFSIDIPIYQGGYVSVAKLEAHEKAMALEAKKREEEQNLQIRKSDFIPQIKDLIKEYELLSDKETLLKEVLKLREKNFSAGKESRLKVLSAQIDLLENRLDSINIIEQLLSSYLNLLDITNSAEGEFLKPIKKVLADKTDKEIPSYNLPN